MCQLFGADLCCSRRNTAGNRLKIAVDDKLLIPVGAYTVSLVLLEVLYIEGVTSVQHLRHWFVWRHTWLG